MQNPVKYFVFNKESDFQQGYSQNIAQGTPGIRIADPQATRGALWISRLLDSLEKETLWHRIVVQGHSLGDASIRFRFYVSETRQVHWQGQLVDLGEMLADSAILLKDKEALISPFLVKTALNPRDMLLHEAQGRYLWFLVELFGQGEESPGIGHIKVYFPKQSWLQYLPEVYQSDPLSQSFTERFLGIFQSLHWDMEQSINQISQYFDPDVAEGEFLQWLTLWINLEDSYIWSEEQLRYLIKNSRRLYKARGTRSSLEEMVRLYTGQTPYIVENFQVEEYRGQVTQANLLDRLYSDSPWMFTLIVNESAVASDKEYKTLIKILENAKPAHTEANLVVLKPYIFLNKYSYLGLNSVLGQYRPVSLDGFSAVPFTSLGAGPADPVKPILERMD